MKRIVVVCLLFAGWITASKSTLEQEFQNPPGYAWPRAINDAIKGVSV